MDLNHGPLVSEATALPTEPTTNLMFLLGSYVQLYPQERVIRYQGKRDSNMGNQD